ncbi:ComEC/Rec2 family competence protein [Sedimentitalea todarodis]|uniref:MBL fold metallo-hydrolase n=1 Tax=Sedimentitalea todarodis TaxID=1631240 RepID=A0ABU3VJZ4_9RHOB|nr:MBL fold metallo-hydrolase [Sedimentitalea todarodis]MDU9006514.1 MBL fold metallo-hydrolase [Sedimentitalea todarodis]
MLSRVLFSVLIWIAMLPAGVLAADNQTPLRVHFIDVGRGDATLFEYPCGTILFDAGGDRRKARKLTDYLDAYFDRRRDLPRRIDLFVLSHSHPDHTRYADDVIKRYEIGTLLTNGHLDEGSLEKMQFSKLLAKHSGIEHREVDTETIPPGGLSLPLARDLGCTGGPESDIRLLWGDSRPKPADWSKKQYAQENNHSVALMASWGDTRTLLTGDMQKAALLDMLDKDAAILADVDLYQVSHHGVPSGIVAEFDDHIRPRIAVLSRPANLAWQARTLERYNALIRGHRDPIRVPVWAYDGSQQAMDALDDRSLADVTFAKDHLRREKKAGSSVLTSAVYWTGIDGTVVVELTPLGDLSVHMGGQEQ